VIHGSSLTSRFRMTLSMAAITATILAGTMGTTGLPDLSPVPAEAQEVTSSPAPLSGHPLVGTWMADTPGGPALSTFAADGSVTMAVQPTAAGPQGVAFVSAEIGVWEATGPSSAHFTAVQLLADDSGELIGTLTIDGYPVVNADGQTLVDDGTQTTFTVRDAAGSVRDVISPSPISAIRMAVGAPGFEQE
jgi:hypothetical protein